MSEPGPTIEMEPLVITARPPAGAARARSPASPQRLGNRDAAARAQRRRADRRVDPKTGEIDTEPIEAGFEEAAIGTATGDGAPTGVPAAGRATPDSHAQRPGARPKYDAAGDVIGFEPSPTDSREEGATPAGASTGDPATPPLEVAEEPAGSPAEPDDAAFPTPRPPAGLSTPEQLHEAIHTELQRRPPVDLRAGNPPEVVARLTQLAKVTTAQHRARGGGRGSAPPPRPPDPLEIDPVPKETDKILIARNARLPALELPAPMPMPNRTVPVVIKPKEVREGELDVVVEAEAEDTAAADASGQVKAKNAEQRAEFTKVATGRAKEGDAAEPAVLPVAIDPPVLLDVRDPEPPEFVVPEAQATADKANVSRALARLLADAKGEATAMVDTSREMAFPGNRLGNAFKAEASDHEIPPLETALTDEMNKLATIAGIAADEISAAVQTRRQELADQAAGRATARTAYAKAEVQELTDEAKKQLAKEARERARDEARRYRRLKSALWSTKPEVVNELLELRMTVIDSDVAKGVLAHERGASRRLDLLTAYESAYAAAYRKADDDAQAAMPAIRRYAVAFQGRVWLDAANDDLAATMKQLRAKVEADKSALIKDLTVAGVAARTALRAWAAKRTRTKLTDDQRRQAELDDIKRQDDAIAATRKKQADGAIRDRLLGQVNFAIIAHEAQNPQASEEAKAVVAKLNDQQRKDAAAFLASGGDPADPMAAVAAAERARFATRDRLEPVATRIRKVVMDMRPTSKEGLLDLAAVVFPDGSFGLQNRADQLKIAFDGAGTTESTVYEQLSGLDPQQSYMLDTWYGLAKGESLAWRIDDEMSGAEYDKAEALRKNDKVAAAEASVSLADGWFSDDPQVAVDALANLSPAEAELVLSKPGVREKLEKVTRGRRWTAIGSTGRSVADDRAATQIDLQLRLNAIKAKPGEPVTPEQRTLQDDINAIAMDRAVRDKGGRGDLEAMKAVAEKVRDQVSRDPRTADLDAEQFDNEVRRRMRGMELAYEKRFAKELPGGGVSALDTAMNWTFTGGEKLDMARAYIHVDRAGQMAARLQQTTRGLYASDSEINQALQSTYDRAKAEVQRSNALQKVVQRELKAELARREEAAGRPLSPQEVDAYRNAVTDRVTQDLAKTWFQAVDTRFGEKYADQWGGDPKRALYRMLVDSTQFSGEDEALTRYGTRDKVTGERRLSGGFLTDAQKVRFGVEGWNMDADEVLGGIGGKTKEQLAEIAADYQDQYDEDMWERLREEAGGGSTDNRKDVSRERFDIDEAKRGVPTNAREALDAARRRFVYERDTYAITAEGLETMKTEFARAEAKYAELEAAVLTGNATTIRNAQAAFYSQAEGSQKASQAYREQVDAKVDSWVQAITLVVVVAAAVAATALSGGTLGPVALAAISSVAGTAATITTKAILLGNAYGKNQVTDDLLEGAVDLAVSIATARVGDILLKLPKATGLTKNAMRASLKQIAAQRAAKPVLARVGAQLAEQVAGSVPTSVFASMLNRQTWKGDPLANVIGNAATAVAASVVIGGVVTHGTDQALLIAARAKSSFHFHFGSAADLHPDRVVLRSMRESAESGTWHPDELRNRGTPEERTRAWKEYRSQFPDATMQDFNRALENGRRRLQADVEGAQRALREMRKEMLASIPPAQRAALADTPIVVLSDAEFRARTGSKAKGYAVTLVIDGRPVIAVRERAPRWALREEGIHVAQLADPVHAEKLELLDERRLGKWGSLSLEERTASWHAKLDLEIDAQQRLIRDLEAEVHAERDPSLQAALRERLDDARAAREVMSGRKTELGEFDASGGRPPPAFLDEPPRLFAKKKTSPVTVPTTAPPGPTAADIVAAKAKADAEARYRPKLEAAQADLDQVGTELRKLRGFDDGVNAALTKRLEAERALATVTDPVERARLEQQKVEAVRELREVLTEYQRDRGVDDADIAETLRGQGWLDVRKDLAGDRSALAASLGKLKDQIDDLSYKLRPGEADDRLTLGGRYYDVPTQAGEVNHIPPDSVNGITSYGRGPAIRMDKPDHRALTSTDNSLGPHGGLEWRAKQGRLIAEGRYFEAIKMDLDEIRAKYPGKYEKGIQQMLDYIEFDPAIQKMNRNSSLTIHDLRNPIAP